MLKFSNNYLQSCVIWMVCLFERCPDFITFLIEILNNFMIYLHSVVAICKFLRFINLRLNYQKSVSSHHYFWKFMLLKNEDYH